MSLRTIKERVETLPAELVSGPDGAVEWGVYDPLTGTLTAEAADAIAHARQDIPALLRVAEAAARDMENCAGCKADERGYCYRHNETGPTLRDLDALP